MLDHFINLYEEKEELMNCIRKNDFHRSFKEDYDKLCDYAKNSENKYVKNLDELKRQILKTKNSNFNGTKKYIVRNHHMFTQLKNYCDEHQLKSEFVVDDLQKQHLTTNIEPSWKCCEQCYDHDPMKFSKIVVNRCAIKVFFVKK